MLKTLGPDLGPGVFFWQKPRIDAEVQIAGAIRPMYHELSAAFHVQIPA
jgi:hypothetical protein